MGRDTFVSELVTKPLMRIAEDRNLKWIHAEDLHD